MVGLGGGGVLAEQEEGEVSAGSKGGGVLRELKEVVSFETCFCLGKGKVRRSDTYTRSADWSANSSFGRFHASWMTLLVS